ncbi:MAG: transcriptional regulator, MarR family [Bacteroidetes bacterium]|nr:transcriptional regulator, MarR family [Bacteroidota bacterium]
MKTTRQYGPKADAALTMWVKLARAFSTFNKLTADHIRSFGLTQPQFGALETLGHLGPMIIGDLCKKQLVSGGNMTVVVDNLEELGLAKRTTSRHDRRAYIVGLTPKGKKLFQKIFAQHAEFVAKIAAVLTEGEQEHLGTLLKKLGTSCRKQLLAT